MGLFQQKWKNGEKIDKPHRANSANSQKMSAILCKSPPQFGWNVFCNILSTAADPLHIAAFCANTTQTNYNPRLCCGVSKYGCFMQSKLWYGKSFIWRKSAIICKEQIVNFYLGIFPEIMVMYYYNVPFILRTSAHSPVNNNIIWKASLIWFMYINCKGAWITNAMKFIAILILLINFIYCSNISLCAVSCPCKQMDLKISIFSSCRLFMFSWGFSSAAMDILPELN